MSTLALGAGFSQLGGATENTGDDAVATEWEEAADDRIHKYRTSDLDVAVSDADGAAVESSVAVEMVEHAFTFGTAIDAPRLLSDSEDAARYREHIPELFNTAVLENQHKWRFWEANQAGADREWALDHSGAESLGSVENHSDTATEWILDHGLDIRGHAALWANRGVDAIPEDVLEALDERDGEHVRERSHDHIETIIDYYGTDMLHWDVVNEAIHEPEMIEVIDGEDVDPVEAPVLADWYRTATDAAPDGVSLDVNDYNTLAGPYEETRDEYERQIEFLDDADGVDLGGVGMQCHFSEDETLTPNQIVDGLDRYAGYGAALRITEFDMADPDWDEEEKAEFLRRFLKTVFSHPGTSDFLMWGFWDGEHWQGDAPLFYEDWEKKPSYHVYTELVFEEWWTDESGTTDEGRFSTRAFLGEHELTVSLKDGEFRTGLSITEPNERSVDVIVADIDVLGAANGRQKGTIPVRLAAGSAFDPTTLDPDTVRFGTPEAVNADDGASLRSNELSGGPRDGCTLHFDAEESALEDGVAMLSGRTDDGQYVVGVDRY
ncbi:endo-1,4-beta-xylanase [Natronococcus occultus]|uniref:endo-1,4-beta-xylanase n=1 Tax=Natronococcus occultus SP4 TaxID=694430 RepID=L0K2X5_9EURY|nr:endo-1,4-beta-xylanase [Natronococcus occultus]AGB38895.1 beta-1,4-xylanase [Natronococcus occultus SP4]